MTRTVTIMIVDDIPLMRTMLVKYVQTLGKKVFSSAGHDVDIDIIEAPNGKIAFEKLCGQEVNLIFLDLMMPEMDGLTFLDQKKRDQSYTDIPVIVCSAVGEDDIVEKARQLGAHAYVTKPFKLKSLEVEFQTTVDRYFS